MLPALILNFLELQLQGIKLLLLSSQKSSSLNRLSNAFEFDGVCGKESQVLLTYKKIIIKKILKTKKKS